jgi:uncharacterized protein
MTKEEYKIVGGTHTESFYEKLLKDKMNTKDGKQIAKERTHYI